ncbi:hypothetical protein [Bacillus sp. 1P06AnD]|uniref:hypothetical protein n=1 Tax=Bacillus sp. 1P06AnD TaxID=3132208 RepID=UPI0039A1FD94
MLIYKPIAFIHSFVMILFIILFFYVYMEVLCILPGGYRIESIHDEVVSVQQMNTFGMKTHHYTLHLSKYEYVSVDDMKKAINQEKETYSLFYTIATFCTWLTIHHYRNGKNLWEAVWESRIWLIVLMTSVTVYNSAQNVHRLIELAR